MKAASSTEIKNELKSRTAPQLAELCLRLARFKKENKELLTFLLFESDDLAAYIGTVKVEMDEQFASINSQTLYWAKKSLRKILRTTGKYIRYTGDKTAEADLLIYFCQKMIDSGIPFRKNTMLRKLYEGQLKKIRTAVDSFHEDLQYDYNRQIEALADEAE